MMKTSEQRESYTVPFSVRILALNRTCVSSFITSFNQTAVFFFWQSLGATRVDGVI